MNVGLISAFTILAGLLMFLYTACDSAPADLKPTPTDLPPVSTTSTTPATPEPTPTDTATLDPGRQEADAGDPQALGEAQTELNRHRALWTSSLSVDYSFVLEPICFCPQNLLDPVRILVEDGVVAEVTYVDSGQAPEHDGYGRYLTIDELFDIIQEGIDRKASHITVAYDPEIGYPTEARIDYDSRMADEEYIFTVSSYLPADG